MARGGQRGYAALPCRCDVASIFSAEVEGKDCVAPAGAENIGAISQPRAYAAGLQF